MATNSKQIKARIKSVKNTKKVTKAMELVAGAKMRRAVDVAISTREYAQLAWQLVERLSSSHSIAPIDYLHSFFTPAKEVKKTLIVVFASNRGLCGAYNSNVAKAVIKLAKQKGPENVEVIAVGKKAVTLLSAFGINPKMAYEKQDSARKATSIVNVANYCYEEFKAGKVDQVMIAYNHFVSSLVQEPVIRPLFPFDKSAGTGIDVEELAESVDRDTETAKLPVADYVHDPSKRDVLSYLVPRLGEVQLFQALLESNASEHSARMLAMKNATDAAGEMVEDLTLIYNRARQAAITQEIAEISAGMAAVT